MGGRLYPRSPARRVLYSRFLNDASFQRGQKGARAVSLTSHHIIFDLNGEALLIPASTTKLISSAAGAAAPVAAQSLPHSISHRRLGSRWYGRQGTLPQGGWRS